MRFPRHGGIYLVRCGFKTKTKTKNQTLGWGRSASRWSAPSPGSRTCREDHAPSHRPQMSSGRLFLDRVGRHQSPSPLHRHAQITTPLKPARQKQDISTLQGIGHFYFALTCQILVNTCASVSAENLAKEATNDAGMANHPSVRSATNCIYLQLAARKRSR